MDNRIGTLDADGSVAVWPKLNIMGGEYMPPASRVNISATQFVVIPAGFTQWELVDALKAPVAPPVGKKPKVEEG